MFVCWYVCSKRAMFVCWYVCSTDYSTIFASFFTQHSEVTRIRILQGTKRLELYIPSTMKLCLLYISWSYNFRHCKANHQKQLMQVIWFVWLESCSAFSAHNLVLLAYYVYALKKDIYWILMICCFLNFVMVCKMYTSVCSDIAQFQPIDAQFWR